MQVIPSNTRAGASSFLRLSYMLRLITRVWMSYMCSGSVPSWYHPDTILEVVPSTESSSFLLCGYLYLHMVFVASILYLSPIGGEINGGERVRPDRGHRALLRRGVLSRAP
eukprot:scaffold47515_cov60-Phaeocystis_antarctica.AAC.3